jgi:hypothetical protein
VVGQHEYERNRLRERQSKGVVRRLEDLLEAVSTPRSHIRHLGTDGRVVDFEQGRERRTLSLVHVVELSHKLPETLSRFAGRGDFQLKCVAKRLQQVRLQAAALLAGGVPATLAQADFGRQLHGPLSFRRVAAG